MKRLRFGLATALALMAAAAAWAQTTGSWPIATITTITGATAVQVAQANPSRRFLQICNTSVTPNHVWIAPINPAGVTAVTPAVNSGYFLSAISSPTSVPNMAGSCFTAPLQQGIGAGWNAVSPTSSATILTLDY